MNTMTPRILALALPLVLAACPGSDTEAAIGSGYVAATTALNVYAALPNADPKVLKAGRDCDAAAWPLLEPVAKDLICRGGPTPATCGNIGPVVLASANAALGNLNQCLTSLGVKP